MQQAASNSSRGGAAEAVGVDPRDVPRRARIELLACHNQVDNPKK